jgi:hypothetical protein
MRPREKEGEVYSPKGSDRLSIWFYDAKGVRRFRRTQFQLTQEEQAR